MTTPDWNFKQVILRVFESAKNALRVFVVNDATSPIPVTITSGTGNTIPQVHNVACALAGTLYNLALPAGTRTFVLKARKGSKVLLSYDTPQTNVLTLNSGFSFRDESTYLNQTLYFKCSVADEVIEVVTYV